MKRVLSFCLVMVMMLSVLPTAFAVDGELGVLPDWEGSIFSITYELNGGVNSPKNPATFTDETALEFAAPTKEGYTFGGWYLDGIFKNKITGIKAGTDHDLEVYAMWCRNFPDVKTKDWFKKAVDYTSAREIFQGDAEGKFNPKGVTTRATIAQILYNDAGRPAVEYQDQFSDVKDGKWYTDAVLWAAKEGITLGYGNGKFGPNDPITREQFVVFLYRYRLGDEPQTTALDYNDADQVSSFAKIPMLWAVEFGVIQGYNGNLNPKGTATRAEAAQIMYNFMIY